LVKLTFVLSLHSIVLFSNINPNSKTIQFARDSYPSGLTSFTEVTNEGNDVTYADRFLIGPLSATSKYVRLFSSTNTDLTYKYSTVE
jgi:hypothetical protein